MKPSTDGLGHVDADDTIPCALSEQRTWVSIEPRCLKVLIVGNEQSSLESTEWSLRHMNVYDTRITTVGTIYAARLAMRVDQFDVAIVDCIADDSIESENFAREICCSRHATIRLTSALKKKHIKLPAVSNYSSYPRSKEHLASGASACHRAGPSRGSIRGGNAASPLRDFRYARLKARCAEPHVVGAKNEADPSSYRTVFESDCLVLNRSALSC